MRRYRLLVNRTVVLAETWEVDAQNANEARALFDTEANFIEEEITDTVGDPEIVAVILHAGDVDLECDEGL